MNTVNCALLFHAFWHFSPVEDSQHKISEEHQDILSGVLFYLF